MPGSFATRLPVATVFGALAGALVGFLVELAVDKLRPKPRPRKPRAYPCEYSARDQSDNSQFRSSHDTGRMIR
jgi:hypothetical protein